MAGGDKKTRPDEGENEKRAQAERRDRREPRSADRGEEGWEEPPVETTFADESESYALDEETRVNFLAKEADVDDEAVMDEIARYTDDADVLEDFAERQNLNSGSQKLFDRLTQHHSESPDHSAEDIDAAWDDTNQSGEESVGGTVVTPDQDIVEELGEAVGLDYDDDEPLGTFDKISERDAGRYELEPDTMRDMAGEQIPAEDTPYADDIAEIRNLARLEGARLEGDLDLKDEDFEEDEETLSEADSLDEDIDAVGDARFPQETGDENTDEDYL